MFLLRCISWYYSLYVQVCCAYFEINLINTSLLIDCLRSERSAAGVDLIISSKTYGERFVEFSSYLF